MENIPEYSARANRTKTFEYLSPEVEEVTAETFGILVYQEQIMKMSQILAGYTAGEADMLRKGMGKKNEAVVEGEIFKLSEKMKKKNHNEGLIKQVGDLIRPFAGYGLTEYNEAC